MYLAKFLVQAETSKVAPTQMEETRSTAETQREEKIEELHAEAKKTGKPCLCSKCRKCDTDKVMSENVTICCSWAAVDLEGKGTPESIVFCPKGDTLLHLRLMASAEYAASFYSAFLTQD